MFGWITIDTVPSAAVFGIVGTNDGEVSETVAGGAGSPVDSGVIPLDEFRFFLSD